MSNASRKDMSKDILALAKHSNVNNSFVAYEMYAWNSLERILLIHDNYIDYYYYLHLTGETVVKNKPLAEEFI
jgi:hypothetical protein